MPPGLGRVRNTTAELTELAREKRKELTPAEAILWAVLRRRQVADLRFRSQHAMGTIIVDFYCPEHHLVIEVDGSIHDTPNAKEKDALRDAHLRAAGYTVLRFRNEEVEYDLTNALAQILKATNAHTKNGTNPSE
jgi:very-short-patch-repair endonuclease